MGIAEERCCHRRCLDFTSAQIVGGIAHHFIEVANEDDIGQTDTSSGDWSQDNLSTARKILSHA